MQGADGMTLRLGISPVLRDMFFWKIIQNIVNNLEKLDIYVCFYVSGHLQMSP